MTTLAEQAGIDTTICEICEVALDDSRPWRRGLDGCGIHEDCLSAFVNMPGRSRRERVDEVPQEANRS